MEISVVMPVYNERQTIEEILHKVLGSEIVTQLIVVDDYSSDGTRDFLTKFKGLFSGPCRVTLLMQERNMGKGAALQRGFEHVTGDFVIVQDADLEYDPHDYPKLLEPLLDGRADVVYGSRFLGGPHRVLYFWHYVANKILTLISNMFTGINLSDMETGYKAFRSSILKDIRLKSQRFGFEPEFTAKVAKKQYRIYETPISYSGRTYQEGKKINWKDGMAALFWIIRYRLMD
jgi:glycosyltransferase involved in cell wall biosynthesis